MDILRFVPTLFPIIFFAFALLLVKSPRSFQFNPVWLFLLISVWLLYLLLPNFSDHNESGVLAISWAWHQGQNLYHSLESSDAYSILYGPLVFFINRISLMIFGLNKATAHLQGLLFLGLSFGMLYSLTSRLSIKSAHRTLIFCSLALLAFGHYSLSNRSEPILFFLVTFALWAQFLNSKMLGLILLGLAMGASFHIKIHSPYYMIPVWILVIHRDSWRALVVPAVVAATFASTVFFISQVDVNNYAEWLFASTQHPRSLYHSLQVIIWALFLGLPLIFLKKSFGVIQRDLMFGLAVCLALTLFFGSKAGSGAHHLLPLIPYFGYLYFSNPEANSRVLQAVCLALIPLAIIKTIEVFNHSLRPPRQASAELEWILKNKSENQQYHLAYSKSYEYSKLRHLPVFHRNSYWIDSAALMDRNLSHSYHSGLVTRLTQCEFEWIVPRGEKPFDLTTNYDKSLALFDEDFLRTFNQNYEVSKVYDYFEIWSCRSSKPFRSTSP